MTNLHLATENPERPVPFVSTTPFLVTAIALGVLLGFIVMWSTDSSSVRAAAPRPDGIEIIVRP